MEKTADGVVVPLDIGWSDVGSWSALWDVAPSDAAGNASGDVIAVDSRNSYAYARAAGGAGRRRRPGRGRDRRCGAGGAARTACRTSRRWSPGSRRERRSRGGPAPRGLPALGQLRVGRHGQRFQVKRIMVKPGAQLSLQMHHHRAEHWIVVRGTAEVTRDEEVFDCRRTSRPTSRSAPSTAWRTRAGCRWS